MQKRARAVESQKMRRTMKGRRLAGDPIKDGMSQSWAYVRLTILWLMIVTLDMLVGFRFELLWPFWLLIRASMDACNKNHNTIVTLANHNSAQMSVLFVCVTATSDLICYLFIPVRHLIFFASTYVWVHLIWQTNGGLFRTFTTIITDKSQALPIVAMWAFVGLFEWCCRVRCDLLVFIARDSSPLASYFNIANGEDGCLHLQGMSPFIPRSLNNIFGAHCLGYPLVLILFSLRYYLKEWRIRRKQEEVARKNESLNKLLVEALPAVYEGPKDYSQKSCNEDDMYLFNGSLDPPLSLPPLTDRERVNGISSPHTNGNTVQHSSSKRGSTATSKGISSVNGTTTRAKGKGRVGGAGHGAQNGHASQQHTPPQGKGTLHNDKRDEDDSCDEDGWPDTAYRSSGGVSLIRLPWEGILWLLRNFVWPLAFLQRETPHRHRDDDAFNHAHAATGTDRNRELMQYAEEEDEDEKSKKTATSTRTGKEKDKEKDKIRSSRGKEKTAAGTLTDRDRPLNGSVSNASNGRLANGSVTRERESSRDTSATNENTAPDNSAGLLAQLEQLRCELRQMKELESDARLQLSMSINGENGARQQAAQLASRIQHMNSKLASMEKMHDSDQLSLQQLEKKYAELANRKNDIERELMAERKAKREENVKKDSVDMQREKERQLEKEVDRLRIEAMQREEKACEMERELSHLRKYKEHNDVQGLKDEIQKQREQITHLQDSLAAENKLKQDLFRALGEAKASNAHLETRLAELDDKYRGHYEDGKTAGGGNIRSQLNPIAEKTVPPVMMSMPSAPNPPPSYNMTVQQSKIENPINYLYTALQQHHSSPTGEHLLFDQAPAVAPLSCSPLSPHELTSRMGKFGAPANPARSN